MFLSLNSPHDVLLGKPVLASFLNSPARQNPCERHIYLPEELLQKAAFNH